MTTLCVAKLFEGQPYLSKHFDPSRIAFCRFKRLDKDSLRAIGPVVGGTTYRYMYSYIYLFGANGKLVGQVGRMQADTKGPWNPVAWMYLGNETLYQALDRLDRQNIAVHSIVVVSNRGDMTFYLPPKEAFEEQMLEAA